MMKAASLGRDGFQLEEILRPRLEEGQLLIKTLACGVCSGDLFAYQTRDQLGDRRIRLGHEPTGEIAATNGECAPFAVGDVVTALSAPAYAEYFVATPDQLVQLPTSVDPILALGEAVACCVHAAGRFRLATGGSVAVVGCGFMGLICQQLALHQGAGFLLGVDPIRERGDMSSIMGADEVASPALETRDSLLNRRGSFDLVIEAAGTQSAIDLATELVAQHGQLVLVGYHQSNRGIRSVHMQQWNYKAIDVVNGHVRRHEEKLKAMGLGMDLLSAGKLDTEPLVTTYPLEDVGRAFQDLSERKPGLFKAVLVPG